MRQKVLSVPYIKQHNNYSCGAAALEMVYKYYGLNDVTQSEIFDQSEKFDMGNGELILKEETLVSDAKNRKFFAGIFKATFSDIEDGVSYLKSFIDKDIPLIVCQQWEINSETGHYRVVTGVDKRFVYFHDPNIENSGRCIEWRHEKFFNHWNANGKMVLGNTCTVVSKEGAKLPKQIEAALKNFEQNSQVK